MEPGERSDTTMRGLNPIIASTLEKTGFSDDSVPAIGLFYVVEHIDDDSKCLWSVNGYEPASRRIYPAKALWLSGNSM